MIRVISVKFRDGGKSYFFDPGELEINEGDGVIVETARGIEFADVVSPVQEIDEGRVVAPLKGVIRVATDYDRELRDTNRAKEKDAFDTCVRKIAEHGLDMKLVDVEYSYNGSKVMFYFTADGRVDFRELVKDLAGVFRTRIELRQIGVRDEAKMLGGLGSCGRPVCCKAFLSDFAPVSIKMAKEQSLSLSPTKISGICGRLMCCLKYEQDCYESMRKQMPRPGRDVRTPDGDGTVLENNVITEKTRVRVTLADGTFDVRDYPFRELTPLNTRHPELVESDESADGMNDDADVLMDEDAVATIEETVAVETAPQEQPKRRPRPDKPRRPRPDRQQNAPAEAEAATEQPRQGEDRRRNDRRNNRPRRRPKDNRTSQGNKEE
ncbi:MAG: stage 0 sporulation family protein [Eubacteriales bacterium]|nr:stage 0 sporulation family protein [Christensenellaceae bacterium]MDY5719261.1 stage 0 sporulation family protein [Eubacteriales bacterium]